MIGFYRQRYADLQILLVANKSLGVLDTDYVEDYYGVDGQVSLLKEDGTRYPVTIVESTSTTPSVPHDAFVGWVDLRDLTDGVYEIQGRIRSIGNNYTIFGAVQSPIGGEHIQVLKFRLVKGTPEILFPTYIIDGPGTFFALELPAAARVDLEFHNQVPTAALECFPNTLVEFALTVHEIIYLDF